MSKEDLLLEKLRKLASDANYRIQRTLDDRERRKDLEILIEINQGSVNLYKQAMNELSSLEADLILYNNKKEEEGLAGIYSGIYSAQNVIPESGEIKLIMIDEKAKLIQTNKQGRDIDVNYLEGAALRSMIAFFSRDVILSNSEYEDFVIYDEPLTVLSGESSSSMSAPLAILGERKQIIIIEQKDDLFANIPDYTTYLFSRVDGRTLVKKMG